MSAPAVDAIHALQRARDSGALEALCAAQGIGLMVLFGSGVAVLDSLDGDMDTSPASQRPQDVDIAVAPAIYGARLDIVHILEALYHETGAEDVDLLLLDRAGPVARHRALGRGRHGTH